jgi:AAA domain, putative AbiEii toxin, Type IV TA system
MLERLHLKNVGPAPELEMEFAPRVNLITGDNGLGKSFLLDVAWRVLTGQWLTLINPNNSTGELSPKIQSKVSISSDISEPWSGRELIFDFRKQTWIGITPNSDNQKSDSLVIYCGIENGYGVYDPNRPIFGFKGSELLDGLDIELRWGDKETLKRPLVNGLIRDWATWQLEKGEAFQQFKAALVKLSPDENEKLVPGKLTRVSLNDARDIPTLKMPYGQEVPITQASAGIRRVVSLAYMLVWTWQEHLRAAELTRQEPAREIVLLIDELEQHLHPRWQRVILPALLETVKELMKSDVRVQIIATTHSPLVMASLEPLYEDGQDAWFDLNLVKGKVTLEKMPWRRHGDASAWLTSEAFDLPSARSRESAAVLHKASEATSNPKLTKKNFLEIDQELRGLLGETDPFWIRWQYFGEDKGWL